MKMQHIPDAARPKVSLPKVALGVLVLVVGFTLMTIGFWAMPVAFFLLAYALALAVGLGEGSAR